MRSPVIEVAFFAFKKRNKMTTQQPQTNTLRFTSEDILNDLNTGKLKLTTAIRYQRERNLTEERRQLYRIAVIKFKINELQQ